MYCMLYVLCVLYPVSVLNVLYTACVYCIYGMLYICILLHVLYVVYTVCTVCTYTLYMLYVLYLLSVLYWPTYYANTRPLQYIVLDVDRIPCMYVFHPPPYVFSGFILMLLTGVSESFECSVMMLSEHVLSRATGFS